MKKNQTQTFHKMLTKGGRDVTNLPWEEYPRPALCRESYFCLNGEWQFSVKNARGEGEYDGKILVPFPPESTLSGVDRVFDEDVTLIYSRSFVLPSDMDEVSGKILLHFGAVDQFAKVYVNGKLLCEHIGGYMPFSVDITSALQAENELVVEVKDELSQLMLPYGKQCRKRGGMWYTPVSGIWQTVWLERVPKRYISSLNADVVGSFVKISVGGVKNATAKIATPNGEMLLKTDNGEFVFTLEKPTYWSPENPYLYHYVVETEEDVVKSYFAVRTLTIEEVEGKKRLCLNGKPYFFHGLLDQGYFSDGIFTPATPETYKEEIARVKALGFNTLRKHIKIEPQIFYAECDRQGMIVWQDMINNGDYKYVRDTVLPTIGFIWKWDKFIHRNQEMRKAFLEGMEETVQLLKCHPCICLWTIFNEGWGQFESTKAYRLIKSMDDTRFIDSTSGWFQGGESDVNSRHIYFRKIKAKPHKKPTIISEFGGYTYSVEGHIFNPNQEYGYGTCKTREEYVERLRGVYQKEIIPAAKMGVCASIYTQVSDVEDEVNGLFTYDREVEKIYPDEFSDIIAQLQKAVQE